MLDYSYPPCTPTYYSLFLNDLSKSTTRLLLKSSFFFFLFISLPANTDTAESCFFLSLSFVSQLVTTWTCHQQLQSLGVLRNTWASGLGCFCFASVTFYQSPPTSSLFQLSVGYLKTKKFQFSLMIHKPVKKLSPVRLEIWLKSWNMTIVP